MEHSYGQSGLTRPLLASLFRGTFWSAARLPLQAALAFWSVPIVQHAIGRELNGAYVFALGFGFLQPLLEFGMGSALQRELSEAWARGDRDEVDRVASCGLAFYGAATLAQIILLLFIITYAVPHTAFGPSEKVLITRLMWIQVASAPFFGLSVVVSGLLRADRRFVLMPKLDLAVMASQFGALVACLRLGFGIFPAVAAQKAVQITLGLGPALWVVLHELGFRPALGRLRLSGLTSLLRSGTPVFLFQLSTVLADRMDTTVIGYALGDGSDAALTVYQSVSKPYLQIRYTGWTLSYLVMPAVASLSAVGDAAGLERIKYDGPRLATGVLLPLILLAGIYARPFLAVWIDPAMAENYGLMRLFLVATLPLVVAVPVQMAVGLGRVRAVALASLVGGLVNLPLSFVLTVRYGVVGVIWGTVSTSLVSNLMFPAVYCSRALGIHPRAYVERALSAPLVGAAALVGTSLLAHAIASPEPSGDPSRLGRLPPLLAHLSAGSIAYAAAYLATPAGRGDLALLRRAMGRRGDPSDRRGRRDDFIE
jgi:O-antigen/teichoic acid export membrane protein